MNYGPAEKAVRIPAMILLFTIAAIVEALHCSSLSSLSANGDIWWHLSSGLWILHNHALPHSGLFSQSSGMSWIASSWPYDLKLAIFYQLLGLASVPLFLMFFKTALGVITFLLAGGGRGAFWPAAALSALAQYIMAGVQPTPAYCSILLFGIELLLLVVSRRRRDLRLLFWLPLLFLVWVNLHIQFPYGIALLALFLAETAARPNNGAIQRRDLGNAGKIGLLSLAATFITPYFYHPWGVFFTTTFSPANSYLLDFRAPGFRQPQDYLLLLLVMGAFLALGLRRSRDPFQFALLAACALLSFYSRRDLWLATLAAVAVIGNYQSAKGRSNLAQSFSAGESTQDDLSPGGTADFSPPTREVLIAAALSIAILTVVAAARIPRSHDALLARASGNYPVAACNYIRQHHLAQPLFNAFEWGGFLTWYLPEYPVAIDGRTDLYGADFLIEYSKVMNADARYIEFPVLANARTILLPRHSIMAEALSSVPIFKVAYSDDVAMVLTRVADTE